MDAEVQAIVDRLRRSSDPYWLRRIDDAEPMNGSARPRTAAVRGGYQRLRRILADRAHPEHGDVVAWLIGIDTDPHKIRADVLDIDAINSELELFDRHRRR